MKNKMLKLVIVIALITVLTMTNFIYVGIGLISYAQDDIETNHPNVEFGAKLKDNTILELEINIKKEGYFSGEITLENSNFELKPQENQYINEMEKDRIKLNKLNAGDNIKLEIELESIKNEIMDLALLNENTQVTLKGKYKNQTKKDIEIEATREVKLRYQKDLSEKDIKNDIKILANKTVKISGEEKKIVQVELNMGLNNNQYPIKEIKAELTIPKVNGKSPEIAKNINLNTMTYCYYNYDEEKIILTLENSPDEQNNILWKKEGAENAVITLIYDKDEDLEGKNIYLKESLKLYGNKTITVENKKEITNIESDSIVTVSTKPEETAIYKGKLNSKIDREYKEITTMQVNLANSERKVNIEEKTNIEDEEANIIYNKTEINKERFEEILGKSGTIIVKDENGKTLGTLTSTSNINENQNIELNYEGKEPKAITIETSEPVKEGNLELTHTRTIKEHEKETIERAEKITKTVEISTSENSKNSAESEIELKEAKSEMTLELNKNALSTVVTNNVEIRVDLKAKNEEYNLYKNPEITLKLPDEVEEIKINNVELLYEAELTHEARVEGKNIIINLNGEQTDYKEAGIDGATLVMNVDITIEKTAPTTNSAIELEYTNGEETGNDKEEIKIIAQRNITAIQNIKELSVETLGEEEEVNVKLEKETDPQTLETEIAIINNNENTIKDVKILGTLPTAGNGNNIENKIIEGIQLEKESKIYYSENEEATNNLSDPENNWVSEIIDPSKVKKYLIEIDEMEAKESLNATYKFEVPTILENSKTAKQGYELEATNTLTNGKVQAKATTITMQTGVGAKLDAKLTQSVGTEELQENSTIKNGEVIKYKVQVVNEGSQDLENVKVEGNVPEGTKLVVPEANYEYIGETYYKELQTKKYETTIESLKIGETKVVEYEVKVNEDQAAGTKLQNTSKVIYGEIEKTTNEAKLITQTADIKVTVKRVTDRNIKLYETGNVQYFAIIENLSNQAQKNIKIKTKMPSQLQVTRLRLLTGIGTQKILDENAITENQEQTQSNEEDIQVVETPKITSQDLSYEEEINIGTLEANQTKVLSYDLNIEKQGKISEINFSVEVMQRNEKYRSNLVTDKVTNIDVDIQMTSNVETKYIKEGEKIIYTINIANNTEELIPGIVVKDKIPSSLSVEKVTFNGKEINALVGQNSIEVTGDVESNGNAEVSIETAVEYLPQRETEIITNEATAEMWGETLAISEKITHIIEEKKMTGTTSANSNTSSSVNEEEKTNSNNNGNVQPSGKMITGIVWLDENQDGKKDENEKLLEGIKVRLLNIKTGQLVKDQNQNTVETKTNENGVYVFSNIEKGEYIAVFEYDTSKYAPTEYKAPKVETEKNSKAIVKELKIEEQAQKIASTDIITIGSENIDNINLGLKIMKKFALKLEKTVSKIIIQNEKGTVVTEYKDQTLAKKEISRNQVNGTTAVIEYKIKVTNIGEVEGYARKIADYAPNDLKFSSELNNDWYQMGNVLYNTSLANEKLKAGESKEIKLTLTKAMNQNNTGLVNNTAEIVESYNELGQEDYSSTPGNRKEGEPDFGQADVLLTIATGGIVYAGITIIAISILAGVAYIVYNKRVKIEEKTTGKEA